MKSKKRKHGRFGIFVLLLAATLVFVFYGYRWLQDNRIPAFSKSGTIKVLPGMTLEGLVNQIDTVLLPVNGASLARTLEKEGVPQKLCPGIYQIDASFTARKFARAVTRGWQSPVNLVISGRMRRLEDIAGRISSQLMVGKEEMLAALKDSVLLSKYGIAPGEVFGLVVPDTYQILWSSTPEGIIARLRKEHDIYWNEDRIAAAKRQGLSKEQAIVLASIVEEESSCPEEYPKIASVYLTRLKKGMKLQACPTVCYIYGYTINRVLTKHLNADSPYNTYKYAGLPPTPISVPGKEHIEAVLNPDATPYLYFCADSRLNGRNVFSVTYSEHRKKAKLYHMAYDEYLKRKSEAAAEAAAEAGEQASADENDEA